MSELSSFGKVLVLLGVILVIVGSIFLFAEKLPWVGKLPGDIYIRRKNFIFYFPITTSIIISTILSFILLFFSKK
ncbi:MAG: DUF2905 domain-containing protein [Nitrospinae bacterium]|nr:DUF2905 domain-containing protein [Nitrospinota bacterium]